MMDKEHNDGHNLWEAGKNSQYQRHAKYSIGLRRRFQSNFKESFDFNPFLTAIFGIVEHRKRPFLDHFTSVIMTLGHRS